ncbi:lipocalin family protein [Flavobacterium sp. HNIBRBA15423]|uniref:lipocalin family protein n=1 Tax=Flavobacterium sp. HNIBRBA15423 TaxID=3458683 RepID=UPI004043ACA6
MKKMLIVMSLVVMLVSCKSNSPVGTKLDMKTEVALKGNWSISSVDYLGSEYIKVTSFNIEDSQCFVGSEWSFVSNNNKGEMRLTKGGCSGYNSPITWYINKDGKLVMKFLEGVKAKKMDIGYVLTVTNVTENSFQLIDTINVGGKSTNVVYQFIRNN